MSLGWSYKTLILNLFEVWGKSNSNSLKIIEIQIQRLLWLLPPIVMTIFWVFDGVINERPHRCHPWVSTLTSSVTESINDLLQTFHLNIRMHPKPLFAAWNSHSSPQHSNSSGDVISAQLTTLLTQNQN